MKHKDFVKLSPAQQRAYWEAVKKAFQAQKAVKRTTA